jgi:hypothetical protein
MACRTRSRILVLTAAVAVILPACGVLGRTPDVEAAPCRPPAAWYPRLSWRRRSG